VLQVPKHDPLPLAAMIAAATTRLGVVATMSTMAYPPFMLARLASTIDHISGGRFGWNIVTSGEDAAVWGAFDRSIALGAIVIVATVLFSFLAGLAFRHRFPGATLLFYVMIASLVMPSVVVSLGIGAMFEMLGIERAWYSAALRAHLTRTLPFGLLIMLAVFNRFNPAYEEASRDLGAQGRQTIRYVVVPIIAPSLLGVALFGFTLSYDEIARTSQSVGALNTLPLELEAMQTNATTPVIYALGAMTTGLSFLVIAVCLLALVAVRRRRERFGSDAGKAV
jgi:putative spermidine/putrescine transport system permease protein